MKAIIGDFSGVECYCMVVYILRNTLESGGYWLEKRLKKDLIDTIGLSL